jgi:hypothetical protein
MNANVSQTLIRVPLVTLTPKVMHLSELRLAHGKVCSIVCMALGQYRISEIYYRHLYLQSISRFIFARCQTLLRRSVLKSERED